MAQNYKKKLIYTILSVKKNFFFLKYLRMSKKSSNFAAKL